MAKKKTINRIEQLESESLQYGSFVMPFLRAVCRAHGINPDRVPPRLTCVKAHGKAMMSKLQRGVGKPTERSAEFQALFKKFHEEEWQKRSKQ